MRPNCPGLGSQHFCFDRSYFTSRDKVSAIKVTTPLLVLSLSTKNALRSGKLLVHLWFINLTWKTPLVVSLASRGRMGVPTRAATLACFWSAPPAPIRRQPDLIVRQRLKLRAFLAPLRSLKVPDDGGACELISLVAVTRDHRYIQSPTSFTCAGPAHPRLSYITCNLPVEVSYSSSSRFLPSLGEQPLPPGGRRYCHREC
jgi:hypothetical protein